MRTGLAFVAFCFLVGADSAADAVKKEMALLDGAWILESGENNGTKYPANYLKNTRQVFKAGETRISLNTQRLGTGTYTIDPSKKPKEITYTHKEGPDKGKVQLGIYELDGDTLKLCLSAPGASERPKEFTGKEGSKCRLTTWKRVPKLAP